MSEDIVINGRVYTMWQQFVQKQDEWIGGTLVDHDPPSATTKITGISLAPNGDDSAFFSIEGKRFNCGFDVRHGGIAPVGPPGITFSGYRGHRFTIYKPGDGRAMTTATTSARQVVLLEATRELRRGLRGTVMYMGGSPGREWVRVRWEDGRKETVGRNKVRVIE